MTVNRTMKKKVLFVCTHNNAGSQMAEAFLNHICGNVFEAYSAGLDPRRVNPFVIEAMHEIEMDISGNNSKWVFDFVEMGKTFAHVILCDAASAERCPNFPGWNNRLNWNLPDPSDFQGTPQEKLAKTRELREMIRKKVHQWCMQAAQEPVAFEETKGSRISL
jgi:arsenate reductase